MGKTTKSDCHPNLNPSPFCVEWKQISVLLVVVRYGGLPVSFLPLNVTVSCEVMNVSEAIRQLSRRDAFNLRDLRLFGTELKPAVGLGRNFTVEQG